MHESILQLKTTPQIKDIIENTERNKTHVLLFGNNSYPLFSPKYYQKISKHFKQQCLVSEEREPILLPWNLLMKQVLSAGIY